MTAKKISEDLHDDRLDKLIEKVEKFIDQYESDMRGDKSLNNGNGGVIGELRKLKDTVQKYPSLTWLFAHRPLPTIATAVGIFVFLTAIYTAGLFKLFAGMVGVNIP
jgi:actin-like ATPase involved in cell morphogenesis